MQFHALALISIQRKSDNEYKHNTEWCSKILTTTTTNNHTIQNSEFNQETHRTSRTLEVKENGQSFSGVFYL